MLAGRKKHKRAFIATLKMFQGQNNKTSLGLFVENLFLLSKSKSLVLDLVVFLVNYVVN
jgi:hypothetical protein